MELLSTFISMTDARIFSTLDGYQCQEQSRVTAIFPECTLSKALNTPTRKANPMNGIMIA